MNTGMLLSVAKSYDWFVVDGVWLGSIKRAVRSVYTFVVVKTSFSAQLGNPCGPFNLKVLFTALYCEAKYRF